MALLTDTQIEALVSEEKRIPRHYQSLLRPRPHRGHSEREMLIQGVAGSTFKLLTRQSHSNHRGFTAILAYSIPATNQWFRLRRHNGPHGWHTNRIERVSFADVAHIHMATERYQALGMREDSYAEPTDRFSNLDGAIQCLLEDVNITVEPGVDSGTLQQPFLFDE
jgi:hypothetical protein